MPGQMWARSSWRTSLKLPRAAGELRERRVRRRDHRHAVDEEARQLLLQPGEGERLAERAEAGLLRAAPEVGRRARARLRRLAAARQRRRRALGELRQQVLGAEVSDVAELRDELVELEGGERVDRVGGDFHDLFAKNEVCTRNAAVEGVRTASHDGARLSRSRFEIREPRPTSSRNANRFAARRKNRLREPQRALTPCPRAPTRPARLPSPRP